MALAMVFLSEELVWRLMYLWQNLKINAIFVVMELIPVKSRKLLGSVCQNQAAKNQLTSILALIRSLTFQEANNTFLKLSS